VFSGKTFIDAIIKESNGILTRNDCIILAQEYLSNFYFKCITITINKFFDDDLIYYRFFNKII
jgi:predicted GNAT family N-acyltransferase